MTDNVFEIKIKYVRWLGGEEYSEVQTQTVKAGVSKLLSRTSPGYEDDTLKYYMDCWKSGIESLYTKSKVLEVSCMSLMEDV
jgi:hypothetical protein